MSLMTIAHLSRRWGFAFRIAHRSFRSFFGRLDKVAVVVALCALAALPRPAHASSCAAPGFVAPDRYPLPGNMNVWAVADLNSDGRPDIVAYNGSNITVLLGQLGGGFGSPIAGPAVDPLIVIGDFDRDGKVDVVSRSGFSLVFLHGNGDGTFQDPAPFAFIDGNSAPPRKATAADVNADGKLDFAFFDSHGVFNVFLGNGDGSFSLVQSTPAGNGPFALGRLDADPYPDLAVMEADGLVTYRGLGDGTFGPGTVVLGESPRVPVPEPVLVDFNSDGFLDIAVARNFDVTVFLGHGDGTVGPPIDSFASLSPEQFIAADLNGDGFPDIVDIQTDVGLGGGYNLNVLVGRGDGSFLFPRTYGTPVAGPLFAAVADFGAKGRLDVALTGGNTNAELIVYRGNGDGTLRGSIEYLGLNFPAQAVAVGDFDEDGHPDFVELHYQSIFLEIGGPGVTVAATHEYVFPDLYPAFLTTLTVADFNGDGHLDVLSIRSDTSAFQVMLGNGDGTLRPAVASPAPSQPFLTGITVADFNRDGFPDVAITTRNQSQTVGSVFVYLGNGDGTFRPSDSLPLFVPPAALAAADFDGDGVPDLAVAGGQLGSPGQLLIFRGRGDGTFDASASYAISDAPTAITLGDFFEDQVTDIAVANSGSFGANSKLTVFRGYNSGVFQSWSETNLNAVPSSLAVADFDGDGHLDIAANGDGGKAFLLPGNGDGTFQPAQDYFATDRSGTLGVGDFDRNGTPDLVVGNTDFGSGGFAILLSASRTTQIPSSLTVIVGQPITLHAVASGLGFLTYQWRKDGTPLADGGPIHGSTTSTLTIDPSSIADAGAYDVLVTDSCASTPSNLSSVTVEFADVPVASPFHAFILKLAKDGVTAGCGSGDFCPFDSVTRGQMAVFLLRSKEGPAYAPPSCTPFFMDVPCSLGVAPWINELHARGVTAGCTPTTYCPADPVTRGQAAVLLLRTKEGSAYSPPPCTTQVFNDVPCSSPLAPWIQELAAREITTGCGGGNFCPGAAVSRAQAAVFLVTTFALP